MQLISGDNMDESIIQQQLKAYRQISGLSNISMISGILSVVCLIAVVLFRGDPPEDFFIAETSIIAVTTGVIALFKIRKHPKLMGKGIAFIGLVCGGAILLYILSFVIVVLVTARFGGAID